MIISDSHYRRLVGENARLKRGHELILARDRGEPNGSSKRFFRISQAAIGGGDVEEAAQYLNRKSA